MTNLPIDLKAATRAEALHRLAAFAPKANKPYRNEGDPLDRGDGVSGLLPYLRHRLLSESEVAISCLAQFRPADIDGLLSELLSRTYWKGWMESRPQVYMAYRRGLSDDQRRFAGTRSYAAALGGTTGLSAFDTWNQESIDTGYLHPRVRKWYASIWIFTLRLPWTLGAAHFQEHLLDGDPASITLAWRSVAGLHTPAKHFLARSEDIAKFSHGQFDLKGRLNESAVALTGPALPPAHLLQLPQSPSELLGERYALLVTPDDLTPESTAVGSLKPQLVLTCGLESVDKAYAFSGKVRDFIAHSLDDCAQRLGSLYGCPVVPLPTGANPGALLGQRLAEEKIPHLVYHQPAVGPWQDLVTSLTAKDVGLRYFPLRRSWDALLYPLADKGQAQFLKAALPLLVKAKGKL